MDVKNKSDATLLKMQILNDIGEWYDGETEGNEIGISERYEELLEIGTSLLGRDPYNIDVYEQMVSA